MPPLWIIFVLLPVLGGAERFNCRGRILGAYYADAKSGCKAFHVCVRVAGGGVRDFRFFCPPGTLFHQEAQTCTDWGDDDPLACPAEIYDGQFDLYKIGSGYDTKKLSSPGNRDEESEFSLQRAETGDRRLSQNNGASDLRAAHSSDFFSGQRDRGRDDPAPAPTTSPQPQHSYNPQARQSFRRPTPARTSPTTTQYTTQPTPPPQPRKQPQQESNSKRKLVRKRPIYVSTPVPPTTYIQITQPPQYSEQPQENFNRNIVPKNKQPIPPVNKQPQYSEQPLENFNRNLVPKNKQPNPSVNIQSQFTEQLQENYNRNVIPKNKQPNPPVNIQSQFFEQPQDNYNRNVVPKNKQPTPPVNIPPQYKDYKDEYVEVSRVTPKPNKFYHSSPPSSTFSQSSPAPNNNFNKKDGLVQIYNFDTQPTSGFNNQNNNGPFKVRNSFSISDVPGDSDYVRIKSGNGNSNKVRIAPTTIPDYSIAQSRATASTPAFKNFNSVSYEPEKNNFVPYSKQNYFNTPSTTPSTTTYETTTRHEAPSKLNTVAYNTNLGFNSPNSNFAESDEDDGQYRPPQGEDDGQYRPELYERELLSGAHSLNIAASGNRLPGDQKPRGKTQAPFKPVSQAAVPRPFRPAPTPTSPPTQQASENYPTTTRPQTQPQPQSKRTFDYIQTYTTTSRPSDTPAAPVSFNYDTASPTVRPATSPAPRTQEPRVQTRPPPPTLPPAPPRPSTRPPFFAKPANKQEDNSYDYAYYDSDPGLTEYDHVEEFGRTKTKQ